MSGPRRALVASDSHVSRDPRVVKQIRWLVESGWVVDSLGRGVRPPEVNGQHFGMVSRSLLIRVLSTVLLPRGWRYRALVESTIPKTLGNGDHETKYALVVLNEIELLPWFAQARRALVGASGQAKVHLDLHEYALSQRSGLLHNLFFRRYRAWQASFVSSSAVTSRSTVSPGVARLWSERFGLPLPVVIRNTPDHVDQEPSSVEAGDLRLVYHGSAAPMRRVDLLIAAMSQIENRFSLHLMLVGKPSWIKELESQARDLANRVQFPPPVDVRNVALALNSFDLEVIFAPPTTDNIRHGLPNKLFESIQGRLGVITGNAPDKADIVKKYGNGVIVDGWHVDDLARTINALTVADIEAMKRASHIASAELNSQAEGARFLSAVASS